MKLFFISDIHGSLPDLNQALTRFDEEKADQIIILGDALYHGPRNPLPAGYNPAEVAAVLNRYKRRISAVRGNCDSEVDQMLIEYPMMETYSTLLLENRKFFLTHGHIYNPNNPPSLNPGDILTFGHTHLPIAEKHEKIYWFNPGSISLPKQNNPKSYGLFNGKNLQIKTLEGQILREVMIAE